MPDTLEFSFGLPGSWWRVPVEEPDPAIRRYVDLRLGRADQLAQRRAQVRQQLLDAVDQARGGGAVALYFANELAPGVPLPIMLTTYRPVLPARLSWEAGVEVAVASLEQSLAEASPQAEVGSWSDATAGVVRERRFSLLTSENGDQVENLRADYWILTADSPEPFLMSFASPVIWEDELEPLAELLDAIVATVSWHDTTVPV